jgi:hypothetical protein
LWPAERPPAHAHRKVHAPFAASPLPGFHLHPVPPHGATHTLLFDPQPSEPLHRLSPPATPLLHRLSALSGPHVPGGADIGRSRCVRDEPRPEWCASPRVDAAASNPRAPSALLLRASATRPSLGSRGAPRGSGIKPRGGKTVPPCPRQVAGATRTSRSPSSALPGPHCGMPRSPFLLRSRAPSLGRFGAVCAHFPAPDAHSGRI